MRGLNGAVHSEFWRRAVRVSPGEGGRLGQRARFDVVLSPGWCWMRSRFLVGGIAAAPHPDGTSVAFVGGVRVRGMRFLQPLIDTVGKALAAGALRRLADRIQLRDGG
jgi:hypothetical protein